VTERTVRVVLTAVGTPYATTMAEAGRTAERTAATVQTAMTQAAARSEAALTSTATAASRASAEAGAQLRRTAGEIPATFRAAGAAGASAMGEIDAAATASTVSVQRLATQTAAAATTAVRSSTAMGEAAARAAAQAATASMTAATATAAAGATAATGTQRVAVAAGEIPATFRAAGAAGATAMGTISAAATAATASVTAASTGMSAATAAAASGTATLSLATRLALGEAVTASAAASAAASTAAVRASTSAYLASAGASRAAAAAAVSASAAATRSAAASTTALGRATAAARTMGATVATSAGRAEGTLRGTRTASLLLVAAFGAAVYASSKFESAMSRVKAATQAGGAELGKLRAAAIQAGSSTQYSATQSADAITELAKAGVSTADILGGALRGTLALAAAGDMDVADSAVVAAKAMNSFGLQGKDMAHIADVIAAAAGKSATDVHGMSLAFAQSSLLAHQTGLSLEQTAGALALFAQNGLVGSDAGTSLKTMLMRLTPQSDQARGVMDELGFSAYDAAGNFVGLSETARRMQKSFGTLTPEARNAAMGVIFGSDAIRAATIVSQAGAAGIDTWTKAANDQGYASKYAATQADNLAGDLEKLKSSMETALIQSGTAANGVLRDMAQHLTAVVRWYSNLSPEAQQAVTALSGVAGVLGLVGAGLLLLLPRLMTTRRELAALGVTGARTATLMGGLARLGVVIGVLTAISMATKKLADATRGAGPDVSKLANGLIDLAETGKATGEVAATMGGDLDDFGDAVKRLAHPGNLTKVVDEFGKIPVIGQKTASLDDVTKKVKAIDAALAELVQAGNASLAADAFKKLAKSAEDNGTSTKKLMTLLPQYGKSLTEADTQQKLATASSKDLGTQADVTADSLRDDRTEAEKLKDTLSALNGINIEVATSQIQFQQSLADLKQAVKDNGHSMDITTDKGRKLKSAFLDAADAAMKNAQAVVDQTNSQAAGNKVLAQDVEALKRQMLQMGFSKAAVDKLLAAYAQIPGQKVTEVKVQDSASTALDRIREKLAATKGKSVTVKAITADAERNLIALGYKVTHLKNGSVKITAPTGAANKALNALEARVNAMAAREHTIHMKVAYSGLNVPGAGVATGKGKFSYGGVVGHASDGLYLPGYAPRVDDQLVLASRGEGVLVPEAVRALAASMATGPAQAIAALNRWGRNGGQAPMATARFGGGATAAPASTASGGQFVGELVLDSGEFLGTISGVVRPMIRESEGRAAFRAKVGSS
jgi:TP901 family phage tail tape measure protein